MLDSAEQEFQWQAESDVEQERLTLVLVARLQDLAAKASLLDTGAVVTMLKEYQADHVQSIAPFIGPGGATSPGTTGTAPASDAATVEDADHD